MILLLRGHIRKSFEKNDLLDLINTLYLLNNNLDIYIHTWNTYSNSLSWRTVDVDDRIVTNEIIYNYFGNLQHLIKHIIIDNEHDIKLIGKLDGNVCKSAAPLVGWKKYWYSKYKIISYISNQPISKNTFIINTRFDVMNNSNNFAREELINLVKNNITKKFYKNKFLHDHQFTGIDNFYIGNVKTMFTLADLFYHHLDIIIQKHKDITCQEILVFIVNKKI